MRRREFIFRSKSSNLFLQFRELLSPEKEQRATRVWSSATAGQVAMSVFLFGALYWYQFGAIAKAFVSYFGVKKEVKK